jgi:hypothetical protein
MFIKSEFLWQIANTNLKVREIKKYSEIKKKPNIENEKPRSNGFFTIIDLINIFLVNY